MPWLLTLMTSFFRSAYVSQAALAAFLLFPKFPRRVHCNDDQLPAPPHNVKYFKIPQDAYLHKNPKVAIPSTQEVEDLRLRAYAESLGRFTHRAYSIKNKKIVTDTLGNKIKREVRVCRVPTASKKYNQAIDAIDTCNERFRGINNPLPSSVLCSCGWHRNYLYDWTKAPLQPPPRPMQPLPRQPNSAASIPKPLESVLRWSGSASCFPANLMPKAFQEAFGVAAEYYGKRLYDVECGRLKRKTQNVPALIPAPPPSRMELSQSHHNIRDLVVISDWNRTQNRKFFGVRF